MKWLGPVVVVLLAVAAELILGRAGSAPDLALFVGRFHPLVVHLPIGFFLLVAAGEAATFHPKLRGRVEPALGLLLVVSAGSALLAFSMGQLLALEGGFPVEALGWHRRLTLLAVMGMAACWLVYDRVGDRPGQGRWVYRGVLGATLGLLSLGAHFGGTMTRGETYLAKYAPAPLQPLLGGAPKATPKEPEKAAAPSAEPLVFQDVVQPILKARCVECHGPEKQKGKLRLDSLEEIMKGGENGAALVAGVAAKSPLATRLLLPANDDDRMPPEGKPGPSPDEIALIQFWIDRGALPSLRVKDALAPTASRSLLERIATGIAKPAGASEPPTSTPPSASAAEPAGSTKPDAPSAPHDAAAKPSDAPASAPAANTSATNSGAPTDSAPAAAAPSTAAMSGPEVLSTFCSKCHGAQKQRGKLRVDSLAAMLKGGTTGAAIVPGNPNRSLIITRLGLPLSNEEHMPPKKEQQPSAAQVAALAAWVRSSSASTMTASHVAEPSSAGMSTTPAASPAATASAAAATAATDSASPADSASASATSATESAAASATPASNAPSATSTTAVDFTASVQPLLREKCGKCHIRDKPAGGLSVAQHSELLEGGFTGPAVVPRDRSSLLLARVGLAPSDDEHMPPEGEPQLTTEQVALLTSWIDQGAPAKTAAATDASASAQPPALAAKAGGCAACSVIGGQRSGWLEIQAWSAVAIALLVARGRRGVRRRVAI
jgi:uncharacterized membrane protein